MTVEHESAPDVAAPGRVTGEAGSGGQRALEGGGTPAHSLLGLQRSAGNAAVMRLLGAGRGSALARQPAPPPAPAVSPAPPATRTADIEALHTSSAERNLEDADAFVAHGRYGPQDVTPGTVVAGGGSTGGFEASYDPSANRFDIVLRAAVVFKDGIKMVGGVPTPADARLTNLVTSLPPPGRRRTAYLRRYQWTAREKAPWLKGLETAIEGAWSQKFEFHINRAQWEWIGATVNVDIQVHEQATAGRTATDHLSIDTVKMPANENLYTAGGTSETGEGSQTSATDQTMLIASTDIAPRKDLTLVHAVQFGRDSDTIDSAATTVIQRFVNRYQGSAAGTAGGRPPSVRLEAHTSAAGTAAHNLDLAQRRANAVRSQLGTAGFTNVTTRVSDDIRGEKDARGSNAAREQRVDMIVDSGQSQVLAAHEFGHAFGLGDEYAVDTDATGAPIAGGIGGTGKATGSRADHDPQAKAMTDDTGAALPGAVSENSDNVMSLGSTVRPQHYATFHAALVQITSIPEWALGPKHPPPTRPVADVPPPGTPVTPPAP
jgi:outer membrane protein OmpA-like peptidoglycan-associated protein